MKIVSINVSLPIDVEFRGETISTGIFKKPVEGAVIVHRLHLSGDGQADLTVHGGEDKAVYAYSFDHYEYWQRLLKRQPLPHGQFGENLTVAGLDEQTSHIGDRWQIGTAQFAITQPRMPCHKLGVRFGDMEMPKLFSKSERNGVYLKVLREGMITAGDEIKLLERGSDVTVKEILQAYMDPKSAASRSVYRRVLQAKDLAAEWREKIAARLEWRSKNE
jgi:MOSC domain-containing protein YiiM